MVSFCGLGLEFTHLVVMLGKTHTLNITSWSQLYLWFSIDNKTAI